MDNDAAYINTGKFFNFRLIGIGLLFFIDFNINAADILPDILGLILISLGLGKSFYINENLAKARKYINIFCIISAVKLILTLFYLIAGRSFDDSSILLVATLFSFSELALSLLVFSNIFKGLEIFFQVFQSPSNDNIIAYLKKSDYMLVLLKIFIILKFCLAMTVQVPILITDATWDNLSMFFNVYLDGSIVKNMLIPPCFIIQCLLGIFLLSLIIPFFFEISKDKDFCASVKSKINGVLIKDIFFMLKRNLNSAFILLMTGCVFFVDLQIDYINILPDFMTCVFFIAGISIIIRTNPEIKNKRLNIYLVLNLFISAFSYITETMYNIISAESFTDENVISLLILKSSSEISYHASVIIFFLIFIEFYSFIKNLQNKHLEFSIKYMNKYYPSSETEKLNKNKNIILRIAAAVFCVKTLSVVLPPSGIILFFHSLILIAFVFFIIKGLNSIKEAVYSYYNK